MMVIENAPAPTFLPVPADGEEFELTISGDDFDPLDIVRRENYIDWRGWKFLSSRISGMHTRQFMLVRPGCPSLGWAKMSVWNPPPKTQRHKPCSQWNLAEAPWYRPFSQRYLERAGLGAIGFGGSEWVDPRGDNHFLCLESDGEGWAIGLFWVRGSCDEGWRWLMEVSK